MKTSFRFVSLALCLVSIFSCKEKKASKPEKFIPVLSLLQDQVRHIDTSLYQIRQYIYVDSARVDTVYLHREQFRSIASDFLSIPDITSPEYAGRFKEANGFDDMLDRAIITYLPTDPEKEEIQSEEILVKPDLGGDKVTNIIINSVKTTKDSSIQKRLLWKMDESFQVTTIKQMPGQPETTTTFKVAWNEDKNE